jgi:MFS transporter, SP family, sugar:H+ symporter
MSLICRGTSTIAGNASWRIPLGIFYVIPSILLVGVFFMPESPRWLLIRGRREEALDSLTKLRRGRFTDEEIEQEFRHLQSTIDATVETGRFREMFQGTNLKRTLIVVGVNIFLQLTGQNFVSLYGAIFIRDLNTINPFTMTSINAGLSIAVLLFTQVLSDVVGRVPLMLTGAMLQTASVYTMGGLGTISDPSLAVRQGITAMVTVFTLAFCLGWAPLSHAVAAELPTQRLRDKTYAFGSVFNIAVQFAVSFSTPYLLNADYANLQSKVGFIFGTTALLATLFTWFFVPECKGRTLEEIDRLFLENVPIRKFRSWEIPAMGLDEKQQIDITGKSSSARVKQVV